MNSSIQRRIEAIQSGKTPKGYKKTKWGIIPAQWEYRKIKDVCEINPSRNYSIDSDVTFIGMTDVSEDGKINNQKRIPVSLVLSGLTPFKRGDILVAKITPCFENGKGANTLSLQTEYGFGSTEFHVLRSKIHNIFLFFHTIYPDFRNKLKSEMTGTAGQKRVSSNSISNYAIPLPPLSEQEAIAEILSQQDRLIDLLQKLIDEKRRQKKYLMQTLLTGRIRLPGFKDKWKTKTLGELYEFKSSLPIPRSQLWDTGICYLHYGDIHKSNNAFIMVSNNSTNIPRYNMSISDIDERYLLKHGDIVFVDASEDYIGACKYIVVENTDNIPFIAGLHTLAGTNKTNLMDITFQRYCFQNEAIQKQIVRLLNGMKVYGLSKSTIIKIKVSLPPLPEQEAIAEILSTADEELSLLERELEQEKLRKKALMQLLLTGLVRVEEL